MVLRFDAEAAPDASTFLFHPDQSIEKHSDGTLTVRFKAGRHRRDVLAPRYMGRTRRGGETRQSAPTIGGDVRNARDASL